MALVRDDPKTAAPEASEDGAPQAEKPQFTEPTGNELEQTPALLDGTRVQVTDGEHAGRMGVIVRREFDDEDERDKWFSPHHPLRAFAHAAEYVIRTRDARNELLNVKSDHVKQLEVEEGWARGQVPK